MARMWLIEARSRRRLLWPGSLVNGAIIVVPLAASYSSSRPLCWQVLALLASRSDCIKCNEIPNDDGLIAIIDDKRHFVGP